ncbi:hypothetical protein EDD17DRAFT_1489638 [Pisolithus thermaeus]|nr:hypothetical protein EV401DRAFT_1877296 [Pisolithus croceorrhizus]KAI6156160.1 hypothetical protein EDD17DRAFT_1489638 [Pisolithus thermaeus]
MAASQLELREHVLCKALELCSNYPWNDQPGRLICMLTQPFSLNFDDFWLSYIMVYLSQIHPLTSLINFEGATITPLWESTIISTWLQDPNDQEGGYGGGGPLRTEKNCVRSFGRSWTVMSGVCCMSMGDNLFWHFRLQLSLQVGPWALEYMEE